MYAYTVCSYPTGAYTLVRTNVLLLVERYSYVTATRCTIPGTWYILLQV